MTRYRIWMLVMLFMGPSLAQGEYTYIGSGMVRDDVTGLVWQQVPAASTDHLDQGVAITWASNGRLTWEMALRYCEALQLGGHSDWRLPNRNELLSLVDETRSSPAIDPVLFPNTPTDYYTYWTSTTHRLGSFRNVCTIEFRDGVAVSETKTLNWYRVRAVRGGN